MRIHFKLTSSVLINLGSIELTFTICVKWYYYEQAFKTKKFIEWDLNHQPHASQVNGYLHLCHLYTPVDEQWVP